MINTMENNIEKCVWKIVSENDKKKLIEGRQDVTFSKNKECFSCVGYKKDCPTYVENENNK